MSARPPTASPACSPSSRSSRRSPRRRPSPGRSTGRTSPSAPTRSQRSIEPETPVVQRIDDGFDWGSAAIGAGSGGALVVIVALGGVGYVARHRIGVAR